jgi:DNA-binding PadR family transcriptional regulator
MSLPHALLGLIRYQPATGYDLKNTFKNSIHFFWNAALPHIYRTLKQMETQGLIVSRIELGEGKPNRKVYRITEAGEKEFLRWLNEPPENPEPRLPMLVKVFFAHRMPEPEFKKHLLQWREHFVGLLEKYEKEVAGVIEQYSVRFDACEDAFYWGLTLDYGMRQARMVIQWCDHALEGLEAAKKSRKGLDA